ncbi:ScbA/BarX family gamma-butyrolactone biosynthesis protein [Streptomyces sp. NBC_00239]|uniref:ScbA/BarX family gamma-butyrolactone biosynthesis protein n=1 Tax=Streptomyces sp. NBC_00239 TaxID=2903640 RepID=UPI002E2D31C5|nr:ScbA/BarX family gamma-butyrolactone biosynthesis protein [Streptomyces sp. NBC_00239]
MPLMTFQKAASSATWSTATETGAARPAELLQLTTTVPREYVHRASLAEVFLTGARKVDGNNFALTGQWPRAHTFFTSPDGRRHDPLQAAETIRQVGLFLAHAEFDVPLGNHFVMWDMDLTVYHDQLAIGGAPSDLDLHAECTSMNWKGKRLADFTMRVTVRRDGKVAAAGGGKFSCISEASYRRIRGRKILGATALAPVAERPRLVAPSLVGRLSPFDVVLAATDVPGRWLVSPDPAHPILFDHGGDHLPGMVLQEAARQAACAVSEPDFFALSSSSTTFHRYAELDSPCWIDAELLPTRRPGELRVQVAFHQDGEQVATAVLTGLDPQSSAHLNPAVAQVRAV